MTSTQYETGRVADRCAATGAPLNPGDPFVAALFQLDTEESLVRRDFTPAAWAAQPKTSDLFASWSGVVGAQEKSGRTVIDTASLLGLFEQLADTDDPKRLAFRYVLALILLRKRVLAPALSRNERAPNEERAPNKVSGPVLLVRPRGSSPDDPPIEVVDPAMDDATVAEITEQLRALLRIDA